MPSRGRGGRRSGCRRSPRPRARPSPSTSRRPTASACAGRRRARGPSREAAWRVAEGGNAGRQQMGDDFEARLARQVVDRRHVERERRTPAPAGRAARDNIHEVLARRRRSSACRRPAAAASTEPGGNASTRVLESICRQLSSFGYRFQRAWKPGTRSTRSRARHFMLVDLLLQLHDAVDERLGPRRAAGHEDVDRHDLVHALDDARSCRTRRRSTRRRPSR